MSRYHVHVIYDVPGWAYHHRARALTARAPEGFVVTSGPGLPDRAEELDTLDLVLLLRFDRSEEVAAGLAGHRAVVVGSVNVGWPDRESQILRLAELCEAVLFINREYQRHFIERHGPPPRAYLIPNGVDTSIFHPRNEVASRPRRVLWIGSQFAAENKGYSLLGGMADAIGELGLELERELVDSMDAPRTLAQMADWYHRGQILVVASETEGTPNPALEAAACGTVVVGTPVGNVPELITDGVNGIIVERDPASILEGLRRATAELGALSRAMSPVIAEWSWDRRAPQFFAMFTELIDARRSGRLTRIR